MNELSINADETTKRVLPKLVGCLPNSPDCKHPADRRKFVPYFAKRKISYETADFTKFYEAVYVSLSADLNKWCEYKALKTNKENSPRVIFDLSDSYMSAGPMIDRLRSIFHLISGHTSRLSFSYKETLKKMIGSSDVVLCGSMEQKELLGCLHENVVIIRDYFGEDIRTRKTSYKLANEGELHILWEGLSHGNIEIFRLLRSLLENLQDRKVHLHIVTDPIYCSIGAKYICKPTFSVLAEVFKESDITFHLYAWNAVTFSSIAAACDFALIPIPEDPVMWAKPENKLLLLWSIGVPVITSRTPSYARVMKAIGAEGQACVTPEDWRRAVLNLVSSDKWRTENMRSANTYLANHINDESFFNTWDSVFSVKKQIPA
jgi:glycosyltransferase involved in cell wall biosynthesis